MTSKFIAYALDFTSFLIQKTKNKDKIKNIILFGSVAREEPNKNSDIDIFIDIIIEDNLDKEFNNIKQDFFNSSKYKSYWKLLDINNNISLTSGILDKWKELKPSIIANGIILYGKYKPSINEGAHKTIFVWENIKPNSKRVLFNKQLFGYNQNNKFYQGLLQKYQGDRLGKGCVIFPLEHANSIHKFFKKNYITVKIKKFLEY